MLVERRFLMERIGNSWWRVPRRDICTREVLLHRSLSARAFSIASATGQRWTAKCKGDPCEVQHIGADRHPPADRTLRLLDCMFVYLLVRVLDGSFLAARRQDLGA